MPWTHLVCVFIAFCTSGTVIAVNANPTPSPSPQSDYKFGSVAVLLRGKTRLPNFSAANVGDRLGLKYSVQVNSRSTGRVLCSELLKPTHIQVDPAANVILNSTYTYDGGGVKGHDFAPKNPFRFIPRSKGPLKVNAIGTGCVQQHPEPWSFESIIQVAGADVTWDEASSHMANGAQFNLDPNAETLDFGDKNVRQGIVLQYRITNRMSRPASFATMQLVMRDYDYLLINNQRISIIDVNSPTLDPFPLGKHIVDLRAKVTLQPGESATVVTRDRPSMKLGVGKWRSPRKGGNYQGLGFSMSFQCFIMQDWENPNDPQVAQIPIGESIVEFGVAAEVNQEEDRWAINKQASKALQMPTLITRPNFAPVYSASILSIQSTTARWIQDKTLWYFLNDLPFGKRMPRMDPPPLRDIPQLTVEGWDTFGDYITSNL